MGTSGGIVTAASDLTLLATGEETASRIGGLVNTGVPMTSGVLRLSYFTARKSETITQLKIVSGNTAAAATPTLCRMGVYSVAGNGDLTLVASVVNDTTLFAATNTAYVRTLTASWSKVAGTRYAFGALVVTAVAAPTVMGGFIGPSAAAGIGSSAPRLSGALNGQTDLPASSVAANVQSDPAMIYGEVLP